MSVAREMLEASPAAVELGIEQVADAIDACMICSQACTACSDSCLAEDDVADMHTCIARCLSCAELCGATVQILSRPGASDHLLTHRLLQACVRACTIAAEECGRHAEHHQHCAICAKACRACVQACGELLQAEAFAELQKLAGA